LTIGYGDFLPATTAGKPVFIVYALLAVPTMTIVGMPPLCNSQDIVETVTSNFASYTMRRIQRQKRQVYKAKHFEIQSLTSLVKIAKQKTLERLETDTTDEVTLPIHDVAERVMESLQHMHHHLQNFMMAKLGADARNIITAERARQASTVTQIEAQMKKPGEAGNEVPLHLSEIGKEDGRDELELLNEYRLQYAGIMGQLLVAKDKLLQLEVGLRNHVPDPLKRTLSEDIEELNDLNEMDYARSQRFTRRSSEF
jgi:Ion channel